MRSKQRDHNDVISIVGRWPTAGNYSGVSNGIPWTIVRTAAGTFELHFDYGCVPISAVVSSDPSGYLGQVVATAPGYVGMRIPSTYGGGASIDTAGSFRVELRRAL